MMQEAIVRSVGLRPFPEGQVMTRTGSLSDREAIDAVKKGHRNAYRSIVDRYKRPAYHVALGMVGDPQDALDISQAAFIRAYRNIKSFDTGRSFLPWFYRILRNLCLDHIKRCKRRREVSLTEALVCVDNSSDREASLALRRAIDALEVEHREIIILHYFEGFSYKEIASTLGKPIGTVMSSLYNARKQLRGVLNGKGQGGERGE